ncbi:class I SAM-dependent methyltransferase [Shewanella canadensis]|uniref:Class I SAM-dependent methyltransferase n=1 Tax=Shewanella canadensis TaxID=271096 RepID=A0A3S0J716_9GAMM|nr:class I SAM-dependent methyltransferase [Shewanella canadensis]RTR39288.1 class I SAM-dependent methyltransferase [Shewanella canadensis]
MSIIKVKTKLDEYRYRAKSADINELSGRTNRSDITHFVNGEIAKRMEFKQGDIVVDIGCGDGTLLEIAESEGSFGIGILPSEEEVTRVRDRFLTNSDRIKIEQGLASKTELPDEVANKVVCNGVFLLDEEDVNLALKEISRITKPNSFVYIGELCFRDETEGKNYGDSILKWLLWVLWNQGGGEFLSRLKQTLRAIFTTEQMLILPKSHYYCTPEEFISRAKSFGLNINEHFPHKSISLNNEVIKSSSRQDYIFIKV